jgi:hypothetical protein
MRGQRGVIRSVFVMLGAELWPLAEARLETAKTYSRLTIELGPYVTSALREVQERPLFPPLLDHLRDGVEEAFLNMEPPAPEKIAYGLPSKILQFSQELRDGDQAVETSFLYFNKGNKLVLQRRKRFEKLSDAARGVEDEPED